MFWNRFSCGGKLIEVEEEINNLFQDNSLIFIGLGISFEKLNIV